MSKNIQQTPSSVFIGQLTALLEQNKNRKRSTSESQKLIKLGNKLKKQNV